MPLASWEFTYNNVTWGQNTDYEVISVEGLNPPDARADYSEKAGNHGAFVFAQFYPQRVVTMDGDTNNPSDFEAAVTALRGAFAARDTLLPLVFKVPGQTDEWRINAVPVRFHFDINNEYSFGYLRWKVQFAAEDPRIYSNVEQTATFAASGTPNNGGTFNTPPTITIPSGAVDPVITHTPTGRYMELTGTAPADLILDFQERTIKTSSGTSYYGMKTDGSTWFTLAPGNNAMTYTGGGTLTVKWRNAWV